MTPNSKKGSPKLKMLAPLCNQIVNLKTDTKTLYYSLLKLNVVLLYIYSTKMTKINTCTRIFKQQIGYLPKNLQIDQSFFASYGTHAMSKNNYFASLEIFIHQGHRTQG